MVVGIGEGLALVLDSGGGWLWLSLMGVGGGCQRSLLVVIGNGGRWPCCHCWHMVVVVIGGCWW